MIVFPIFCVTYQSPRCKFTGGTIINLLFPYLYNARSFLELSTISCLHSLYFFLLFNTNERQCSYFRLSFKPTKHLLFSRIAYKYILLIVLGKTAKGRASVWQMQVFAVGAMQTKGAERAEKNTEDVLQL